ncbi:hypothetical protein WMZ97_06060 [Lentibacillus sp. N15]|uniref:hypothetical protein n=1 Tax=Lentibacillus songyuanensis TaxID=3136161 RepID=UPI0031BB5DD6
MIHNLILNKEDNVISWRANKELINVTNISVESAIVLEELDQVLAIDEKSNKLVLFKKNGDKILDISPPPGYDFAYVTHHNIGPVVVCSKDINHGWEDWNFAIDLNTGELKKHGKAY